jgi:glycosyltransferase involved in cell wall biosynthesis
MLSKFKFAICLPTFNDGLVLKETIESILQDIEKINELCDFTFFISNNNSTDNTEEIVLSYKEKYPELNIKYNKNLENIGALKNLVKCAELASEYDYVTFVGDDVYFRGAIPYLLELIIEQNKKTQIICFPFNFCEDPLTEVRKLNNGKVPHLITEYNSLREMLLVLDLNILPMMCFVFRKDVIETLLREECCHENYFPHSLVMLFHLHSNFLFCDGISYIATRNPQKGKINAKKTILIALDLVKMVNIVKNRNVINEEEYNDLMKKFVSIFLDWFFFPFIRYTSNSERISLLTMILQTIPLKFLKQRILKIVFYILPAYLFWGFKSIIFSSSFFVKSISHEYQEHKLIRERRNSTSNERTEWS